MNYVKLGMSSYGSYHYKGSSSVQMDIIGLFLKSDVGCLPSGSRNGC